MSEREKKIHRARRIIFAVLGCMTIIASLVIMRLYTSEFRYTRKLKEVGGYMPAIVVSGSMEPVIKTNAVILIDDVDMEDIKVGDIIAFYQYGYMLITHRVVKIDTIKGETAFITKGDANTDIDELYVYQAQYAGKVERVYNWASPFISSVAPQGGILDLIAMLKLAIVITIAIKVIEYIYKRAHDILLARMNMGKENACSRLVLRCDDCIRRLENIKERAGQASGKFSEAYDIVAAERKMKDCIDGLKGMERELGIHEKKDIG